MLHWLFISGGCFIGFLLFLFIGIVRKSKTMVLIALIPLLLSLIAAGIVVFKFATDTYESVQQEMPRT